MTRGLVPESYTVHASWGVCYNSQSYSRQCRESQFSSRTQEWPTLQDRIGAALSPSELRYSVVFLQACFQNSEGKTNYPTNKQTNKQDPNLKTTISYDIPLWQGWTLKAALITASNFSFLLPIYTRLTAKTDSSIRVHTIVGSGEGGGKILFQLLQRALIWSLAALIAAVGTHWHL